MTPSELNLYAKKYYERKKNNYKEKITIAYYNAKWTIQWLGKKSQQPEPLSKILENLDRENKVMTADQMFKRAMVLNKLFGGEVKENS